MCLDVLLGAGAGLLAARAQAAAAAVEDWVVVAANCVLVALIGCSFRRKTTDTTKHTGADHMASR